MTLPRSYCQDKSVNLPMVSFDFDCVKVKKDMGFTVHTSGLQNYGKISLRKQRKSCCTNQTKDDIAKKLLSR